MVVIKSVDSLYSAGTYENVSQCHSLWSSEVCLHTWGAVLFSEVSKGTFMCTYMRLDPLISEGLSVVPNNSTSVGHKQKSQEGVHVGSQSLLFQKGFHWICLCQMWLQFWIISPFFAFSLSSMTCKWQLPGKLIFSLFRAAEITQWGTVLETCGHLAAFMGYSKICNHIPGT